MRKLRFRNSGNWFLNDREIIFTVIKSRRRRQNMWRLKNDRTFADLPKICRNLWNRFLRLKCFDKNVLLN